MTDSGSIFSSALRDNQLELFGSSMQRKAERGARWA